VTKLVHTVAYVLRSEQTVVFLAPREGLIWGQNWYMGKAHSEI